MRREARAARRAREKEGAREGGMERLGWVSGVDLIARHYCGILLDGRMDAGQRDSTAQHSKAEQSRQQISAAEARHAQSPIWLEAFLASLCRGHSQLLPNTPHASKKYMYVRGCMYMWCCFQQAVPMCCVVSCTHSILRG